MCDNMVSKAKIKIKNKLRVLLCGCIIHYGIHAGRILYTKCFEAILYTEEITVYPKYNTI